MNKGIIIGVVLALSPLVYAGGFEFPANGTEALGRGGAFTAKASDGTALEYNIAGLAQQRGTRLLVDGNLVMATMDFQRSGVYPDAASPQTPWGGQPYPLVKNTGGPFFAPFGAVSSDFGLDRWTFALGVFGPSSVGNRTYPLSVGGVPSPARYDVVQAMPLLVLPTLAAAVRVTRWLDLGLALHVVVGHFDLTSVSYTDISASSCPNAEYQPCDSVNHLLTTGTTATAALGVMLHPVRWWALGANLRGPIYLNTSGTVNATPPAILKGQSIMPGAATLSTTLPWVLHVGTRFILARDEELEKVDFELDATWEGWGAAQNSGPQVNIPALSIFNDVQPNITHHYHDTFSLRAGSGYNARLPIGVLGLRLGLFYDSSATDPKDTRLDFDTLAKLGITGGIGYTVKGFSFNLAYAFIYDFDRTVTDGDIAPINGAAHGQSVDDKGNLLPAVNNGTYHGQIQIISFGVTVRFDELLGRKHVSHYADENESVAPPARPILARNETRAATPSERDDARLPEASATAARSDAVTPTTSAAMVNEVVDSLSFEPERISHTKARAKNKKARRRGRAGYWTGGF